MYITPQRRRRALECQKLRQQGYVIRDIATLLDVSPATVHADLKLLETNWSDVTGQARRRYAPRTSRPAPQQTHRAAGERPARHLSQIHHLRRQRLPPHLGRPALRLRPRPHPPGPRLRDHLALPRDQTHHQRHPSPRTWSARPDSRAPYSTANPTNSPTPNPEMSPTMTSSTMTSPTTNSWKRNSGSWTCLNLTEHH